MFISSLHALKFKSFGYTWFELLPVTPDYQVICKFFLFSYFRRLYSSFFYCTIFVVSWLDDIFYLSLLQELQTWMCRFSSIFFFVANTTKIMHICIYIYIYIYIYMYIYECTYISTYTCIYIYIYLIVRNILCCFE